MQFFRQYIAPFVAVLIFALALVIVSARIFLPEDMSQPAPVVETEPVPQPGDKITLLLRGLPPEPAWISLPSIWP
ncbi:hypothetical protein [Synechococcus sp. PCC 6312]|uniref:hypothetical protein n=1 Tax=Synechococcus sp. (strain ATCC 27167 / PCC 6312) TaxID=195253 RepID=UPI00029F20A3|nr:hypothetical protein [Synechococcus sp. PCC 6312]AFY60142.1 hypothetical protein Syn6312_0940 [Synechococcus sp. PCC 6312]